MSTAFKIGRGGKARLGAGIMEYYMLDAYALKPFTLQLYLHTGIGALTFGTIQPTHPDTLMQTQAAIEALPPQVAPMRWVTSMADKVYG